MTQREATRRREFWERSGPGPCEHPVAALEETAAGYLTGRYLCTTCGQAFERGTVAQLCAREAEFV
jgi:hypothetical protein